MVLSFLKLEHDHDSATVSDDPAFLKIERFWSLKGYKQSGTVNACNAECLKERWSRNAVELIAENVHIYAQKTKEQLYVLIFKKKFKLLFHGIFLCH